MNNSDSSNKIKLTQISKFKAGVEIQGFFVCREKHLKMTKNGDPYLDVSLSDKSGKIVGRLWDNASHFDEKFNSGSAVAVKGIPVEYNQTLQLQIKLINEASPDIYSKYGFNSDELIKVIKENPDKLRKKISDLLDTISDSHLKKLCKTVLKKYSEKISSLPASLNIHYIEKGGLLKHTFNCMKIGKRMVQIYPELNMDILMAGLFLHDIGKLKSYNGDLIFEETDESRFNNHPELGWEIIMEELNQIKKFPEILKFKLKHILFTHHNLEVDGALQEPCFPEALLILHINKMDAGLNVMQRIINDDITNDEWTDRFNPFKRQLYKF